MMRLIRRPFLAIGALTLVAMSGCAAQPATDEPETGPDYVAELADQVPAEVRDGGPVVVAASAYPTAVIVDGDTVSGWEPAIAEALGDVLGLQFEFEIVPFASIIPGLDAGRYDVAMNSLGVTEERLETVTFVTDYIAKEGFMIKAGGTFSGDSLGDLCGRDVGVLAGSNEFIQTQDASAECAGDPIRIQTFNTQPEANLALESDRVEVVVAAIEPISYVIQTNPGKFEVAGTWGDDVLCGMAVARTDYVEEFASALSAAVNHIIENGKMQQIMDEWNNGSGVISESNVLPES